MVVTVASLNLAQHLKTQLKCVLEEKCLCKVFTELTRAETCW